MSGCKRTGAGFAVARQRGTGRARAHRDARAGDRRAVGAPAVRRRAGAIARPHPRKSAAAGTDPGRAVRAASDAGFRSGTLDPFVQRIPRLLNPRAPDLRQLQGSWARRLDRTLRLACAGRLDARDLRVSDEPPIKPARLERTRQPTARDGSPASRSSIASSPPSSSRSSCAA